MPNRSRRRRRVADPSNLTLPPQNYPIGKFVGGVFEYKHNCTFMGAAAGSYCDYFVVYELDAAGTRVNDFIFDIRNTTLELVFTQDANGVFNLSVIGNAPVTPNNSLKLFADAKAYCKFKVTQGTLEYIGAGDVRPTRESATVRYNAGETFWVVKNADPASGVQRVWYYDNV